ncbi:hypothetical protein RND81_14G111300 [Saponaria officinalis]|uniref:HMA domain-containing protein n=1 Tax=Saponaria officinalis TaxID=3572 RepID=A0AAW1GKS0_SAPOF
MCYIIVGLDSISVDMKERKLTLTGDIDPVIIVSKLRKVYQTEIISVGPVKEPEKKKDEPKKEEPKGPAQLKPNFVYPPYYHPHLYNTNTPYYAKNVDEDPNACVIC